MGSLASPAPSHHIVGDPNRIREVRVQIWNNITIYTLHYCNPTCLTELLIVEQRVLSSTTTSLHSSWVRSVAFSSNSKLLTLASDDKTIWLWGAATDMLQQTLEGHSSLVWSVAFSADSTLLASASGDKTVWLWDTVTGTLRQTLKGHSS